MRYMTSKLCKFLMFFVVSHVFLTISLGESPSWSSPGTEVFQGFTNHISTQIYKDKQAFSIADTCTVWFYKKMGKEPKAAQVERIHFVPLSQSSAGLDCSQRYPEGLEGARKDFGESQQQLSLSLTFYQMALLGDGDDNEEYSPREIQDVLEAFHVPFQYSILIDRYLRDLTGLFDTVRSEAQFQMLMEGMQTLLSKGYRLTGADQAAMSKELG